MKSDVIDLQRRRSVVVITSALHAEGRRFEPGRWHHFESLNRTLQTPIYSSTSITQSVPTEPPFLCRNSEHLLECMLWALKRSLCRLLQTHRVYSILTLWRAHVAICIVTKRSSARTKWHDVPARRFRSPRCLSSNPAQAVAISVPLLPHSNLVRLSAHLFVDETARYPHGW